MKQRLQRILSVLCILALITGCMMLTAAAEEEAVARVITVQWDDEDDYEGARPESITVSIGGQEVVLNEGNDWTGEGSAPLTEGWDVPNVGNYYVSFSGTNEVTVVTCMYKPETTFLNVPVKWNDNNNAAGLRPDSVRINLLADGEIFRTPVTVNTAKGDGTASWENLPVFRKGTRTPIQYSIAAADEVPGYIAYEGGGAVNYVLKTGSLAISTRFDGMPEGADLSAFTVTVSGPDPQMPKTLTFAELSSGTTLFTVIPGAYVLEENNASTLIPGYVLDPEKSHVGDGVQVKTNELAVLNCVCVWKEEETVEQPIEDPMANIGSLSFEIIGPEGFNPVTVTYAQFTDGKYVLENLVPGSYAVIERNAEGLVEHYSLQSDSITAITVMVGADGKPAVLFNKYAPPPTPEPEAEYVDIPVVKIWNDNDNKDGNRPESITVNLYANGNPVGSHVMTAEEGWQYTFMTLDRYDADRNEIVYTVDEDEVFWYTSSVNGYFITNTYTPETTSASVTKFWDDRDNDRNIRPSSVAVTLIPTGDVYVLTSSDNWTLRVDNLPTRLNGEPVGYSWVEEETVGYVLTGESENGNDTVLTNRAPEVPTIPPWMPQAKVPGDAWFIFEEYSTALGGELLINHVGDCFD